MGKRKAKHTLTKIDPSILEFKPTAISQHASHGGARVTTAVNPIQPSVPSVDSLLFDFDPGNFNEEHAEGDVDEEDVSKGYYVARVCFIIIIHFAFGD